MRNILFIDIKTTGFDPSVNEIISCTIIDSNGDILLDSLVKPKNYIDFGSIPDFHEIEPETVDISGIEYSDLIEQIREIVNNGYATYDTVVSYNLNFDLSFFPEELFSELNKICLMEMVFGYIQENPEFQNLSNFIKLSVAAFLFDINFLELNLLSSYGDCELTRRVWDHISSDSEIFNSTLKKYNEYKKTTKV